MSRYAAQAVTVEGYGDPEIVVQSIGAEPNDWPIGDPVAALALDGDFTAEADLDHALDSAGYARTGDWTPADFGLIATVVSREVPAATATPDPWAPEGGYPPVDLF